MPVCAGNWKMNPATAEEFTSLARELRELLTGMGGVERVVCPPFVFLERAHDIFDGSDVALGAQNAAWETRGAFTGEISPLMLADLVTFVIVGHSERRALFGETDESVNKRTAAVLRQGLHPIVCVGETLDEREGGRTEPVLERQVHDSLAGIDIPDDFVVAYEPVWAIGTGRAATAGMANEAVGFIRGRLAALAGQDKAQTARILYGGSVTAANIAELMAQPEIDGALVGGASLKPAEFYTIASAIADARG